LRGEEKYSIEMRAKYSSLATPYYQAGIADTSILCDECEAKFTPWDTYGFDVLGLRRGENEAIKSSNGIPMAIPIEDVDHELLTLFLLSVLWRASVSRLDFFHRIDLGPRHEERVRNLLWANTAPPLGEYATLLGTSLEQPYAHSIIQPEQCRDERKTRFNRLYFPHVFALIKTDRRDALPVMQRGMLQPRKTNFIFCFPYEQSPYFKFFERMKRRIRDIERIQGKSVL
jgi:hypothetical protein